MQVFHRIISFLLCTTRLSVALPVLAMAIVAVMMPAVPALAEGKCPSGYIESNVLGEDIDGVRCAKIGEGDEAGNGIFQILYIILNVLTFGVGVVATVGIAISGFQYLTARDNETTVAKAKMRLIQIAIGLVVYAMMWTLLEFVIPGGIFNTPTPE